MECLKKLGRLVVFVRIELFIFLFVMSYNLSDITTFQLIQDKICQNKYNKSGDYCVEISTLKTSGAANGEDNTKSKILADLAQFQVYISIIASLPSFFYVLFIGSWTDNYIHGRKITFLLISLGYIGQFGGLLFNAIKFDFDVYYILLAYIPSALTGGWSCAWLTAFSYTSNNSGKKYRFLRFGAIMAAINAAGPLGTYLSGRLLGTGILNITNGQIHNYELVFTISLIATTVNFIWIIIVINENKAKNDENSNLINTFRDEIQETNGSEDTEQTERTVRDQKFKISKMFDIENIKDVFITCFKVRPNKGRAQLWLLYLCMCFVIMTSGQNFQVLFPYVESVYEWDVKQYTQIKSIASIIQTNAMGLTVLTLSGLFKLTDTKLGIIGFLSVFFADLCIGSLIYPLGLYLMYAFGSISDINSIAIRSLISKTVPKTEIGKVFSLLAAMETLVPPLNVLIYNTLFEFTINFYPSLCFQIAAALVFVPISIFIWIDLTHIEY